MHQLLDKSEKPNIKPTNLNNKNFKDFHSMIDQFIK